VIVSLFNIARGTKKTNNRKTKKNRKRLLLDLEKQRQQQ